MNCRLLIGYLAGAALVVGGCDRSNAPAADQAKPPAVPVSIGQVQLRDMPDEIQGIGNVESLAAITLRPQVDGQLTQAKFVEGQEVTAGELLLVIDPRPFQAALDQAQAKLAMDTARAEDAQKAAAQMAEALQGRAMSQREADRAQSEAQALQAQVESDKAAVEAARLQVEYCSITAPITGRAGALLVKPGNVVKANETDLVQINQLAPIYVSFSLPEQQLARVRAEQAKAPLPIQAVIPGDSAAPVGGTLVFIDNRVDQATGTIRMRGEFANDDRRLWPGQFVNVVLIVKTDANALVVPAGAVQTGQGGSFVFVVKPDRTVEQRWVTIQRRVGSSIVISHGLAAGETVVTDGQLRLVPGSTIEATQPVNTSSEKAQSAPDAAAEHSQ
jgi:multidrug efflux system membrane fusion protein